MNVLDLFSGIGGFSLGLERAGMRTTAFCEIDPYCRRVLAKHWPDVPVYDDVRTLTAARLLADADSGGQRRAFTANEVNRSAVQGERSPRDDTGARHIDVICGGFPCQDISTAGKGAGITGERSGLWREYARIIGEVRPRYVIVENVAALLHRGLGDVLGDLAALGYDAEWHCIRASDVGAPHRRDRVWIVAYPQHPDADSAGPHRAPQHVDGDIELRNQQEREPRSICKDVGHPVGAGLEGCVGSGDVELQGETQPVRPTGTSGFSADADIGGQPQRAERDGERWGRLDGALGHYIERCRMDGRWLAEPDVGRVAHGVPARVDRLRALGNAVVPQIPELIGRAIMGGHSVHGQIVHPRASNLFHNAGVQSAQQKGS